MSTQPTSEESGTVANQQAIEVTMFSQLWMKAHPQATVSQFRSVYKKGGRSQPIVLVTAVFRALGWRCRNQTSPASRHFMLTAIMDKWPVLSLLLDLSGFCHSLFYMPTLEHQHLMIRYMVPSHQSGMKISVQRSFKQIHEQVYSSQDFIKVMGNTVDKCH